MESRAFIKYANLLIKQIKDNQLLESVRDSSLGGPDPRVQIQKELNQLFSSLHNPTLPTAYRLRDTAIDAGYTVSPKILQGLAQFEFLAV